MNIVLTVIEEHTGEVCGPEYTHLVFWEGFTDGEARAIIRGINDHWFGPSTIAAEEDLRFVLDFFECGEFQREFDISELAAERLAEDVIKVWLEKRKPQDEAWYPLTDMSRSSLLESLPFSLP